MRTLITVITNKVLLKMTSGTENSPALDLIWGATEIAKTIGRSQRATFGMLEKGELPARKVSGRWVIERSKLIAVFTGEAA